jgi:hypothetical protein
MKKLFFKNNSRAYSQFGKRYQDLIREAKEDV